MQEPLTISTTKPPFTSMDFALLREQGIEFIQQLSSQVWTDYNVHDPGITILEHIAYGITDLGFRTNFDIKDVLTSGAGGASSFISQFFTPGEILSARPATLNDYRKIIIDHDNIRRAWIQASTASEQKVYLTEAGHDDVHLTYLQSVGDTLLVFQGLYTVILEFEEDRMLGDLNNPIISWVVTGAMFLPPDFTFNIDVEFPTWNQAPAAFREKDFSIADSSNIGLVNLTKTTSTTYSGTVVINHIVEGEPVEFDVKINLITTIPRSASEADVIQAIRNQFISNDANGLLMTFQKKIYQIYSIIGDVRYSLMSYRNLSEDFFEFKSMEVEEVGICTEIEIRLDADADTIQATILYELDKIISPIVEFKTLQELLAMGRTTDQIFDGPLLTHGFIDDQEIKKIDQFPTYYLSEFISTIMDIDGVVAVRSINASTFIDDIIRIQEDTNCFSGSEQDTHRTKLSISKTHIFFVKDDNPNDKALGLFIANRNNVNLILHQLQLQDLDPKIADDERDLPIPLGEVKDLIGYYPVQSDFPMNYGVGETRLSSEVGAERIAQVKELKAYLLFYEQQLANFLSQLYNVGQLFSFDEEIKRTYFTQPLYQIPFVANLIKAFTDTLPSGTNLDDFDVLAPLFNTFIAKTRIGMINAVDQVNRIFTVTGNITTVIDPLQPVVVSGAGANDGTYSIAAVLLNGSNTDITVVESIPDTTTGQLTYFRIENTYELSIAENAESESVFLERRSRFLDHLLARFSENFVDVLIAGTLAGDTDKQKLVTSKAELLKIYPEISSNRGGAFNYKKIITYDIITSDPVSNVFTISGNAANTIGLLSEIVISEAGANDGTYQVLSVNSSGTSTAIKVSETISSTDIGQLIYPDVWNTENVSGYEKRVCKFLGIEDVTRRNLFFNINDYLDKLAPYFVLTGSTPGNYGFTLQDLQGNALLNGSGYADETYRLQVISDVITYGYNRCYFELTGSTGTYTFAIKKVNNQDEVSNLSPLPAVDVSYPIFADADDRSALIDSINTLLYEVYWNHEGVHMVEHLLLRPIINDEYFHPIDASMLVDTNAGTITYRKDEPVSSVNTVINQITIAFQDLTAELNVSQSIQLIGSTNALYDGTYTISSIGVVAGDTLISVLENIPDEAPVGFGAIWYSKTVTLDTIVASEQKITIISRDLTAELHAGTVITVASSPVAIDNGDYIIAGSSLNTGNTEIILKEKKLLTQDNFLPVSNGGSVLDDDCNCPSFYDPYNFRLTMILPSWTERSRTKVFRTYSQQIIRSETPAHLFVNIFWLGTFQMRDFENVLRPWLEEKAKPDPDPIILSKRLNDLLLVLPKLRSEFVPAELHNINDPNDSGSLLVLGETILGTY